MKDATNGPKILTGGVIDLEKCKDLTSKVATFDNADEAEVGAKRAGWKIVDGNHRCKDCNFEKGQRRGMIVDLETLQEIA